MIRFSFARVHRRSLWLAVPLIAALVLGASPGVAHADLSKKVIAAFKGKVLVTTAPLEPGTDDKGTIAHFKKAALSAITGAPNAEDVTEWTFVYTAFLKQRGDSSLKLEFHEGKKYVADKTLSGIDPSLTVLEGDISINEDDGLVKGRTYTLKLVADAGGKEAILASTTLTMN